jgi:hypothetical protein
MATRRNYQQWQQLAQPMTANTQRPTPNPKDGGSMMGAPMGNKNATRHGLVAGRLPAGCRYIARDISRFRSALEQAVIDAGRDIDIMAAAAIQSATRWETHAQLCRRWLRTEANLDPDQRLAFSREIARASSERDKCLDRLGLDRASNADPWKALDASSRDAAPKPEAQAVNGSNAADAKLGPQNGTPTERAPESTR